MGSNARITIKGHYELRQVSSFLWSTGSLRGKNTPTIYFYVLKYR